MLFYGVSTGFGFGVEGYAIEECSEAFKSREWPVRISLDWFSRVIVCKFF
jgi:hypothetical protein